MQGTITWLPATEENIKKISQNTWFNIRFYTAKGDTETPQYTTAQYIGSLLILRGNEKYKEFTHFAFINEPE